MYIEINNTRLFYSKQGEGEPIILIHGNGESHKIFLKTIEDLCKDYTVYALDMRGQGESDKIEELHYEDMASDVIEFITKKNIKSPYYFGFSDGGIVGLIAAYKSPAIFKKMMIAGANSCPKGIKKRWYFFFKLVYLFSRNKILKVMFNEPNITAEQLQQIRINTIIIMGQRDVIKQSEGTFLIKHLQNSKLISLKKEGHISYVLNSKKLVKLMREHLLYE